MARVGIHSHFEGNIPSSLGIHSHTGGNNEINLDMARVGIHSHTGGNSSCYD